MENLKEANKRVTEYTAVFAYSRRQFEVDTLHGLTRDQAKEYIYVTGPDQLRGRKIKAVVFLPDWHEKMDTRKQQAYDYLGNRGLLE